MLNDTPGPVESGNLDTYQLKDVLLREGFSYVLQMHHAMNFACL